MLYEMLYGKTPWSGANAVNLLENIQIQVKQFFHTNKQVPKISIEAR